MAKNKTTISMTDEAKQLIDSKNAEIKMLQKILQEKKDNLALKEQELSKYINSIFEQQERERIIRWITDSIRMSLDLNKVLSTTTSEIGKLLQADRCVFLSYNEENGDYSKVCEYIGTVDIKHCVKQLMGSPCYELIVDNKDFTHPIIIDSSEKSGSKDKPSKAMIAYPVLTDTNKLYGYFVICQSSSPREWSSHHIEILKDIMKHATIAIIQAQLYSKVQGTSKLKSEFLASMSHELRTPLNAIIGFSEMLMSCDLSENTGTTLEYINNITVSGRHLLRLVNDILDLSKIESGNMDLNYEEFNTRECVLEVALSLESLAREKNITVNFTGIKNIIVIADSKKFRQIIYNLISNAIKFTENDGHIDLKSMLIGDKIKICVKDTGIGIPKKEYHKIFCQFEQINSSYLRRQSGTGLGLSLSKKIVDLHNGEIGFESKENSGSTFWFILPMAKECVY